MTSPFAPHKRQAGTRALIGAVLIVIGVTMANRFAGFFTVLAGVYLCAGGLTRLIRIRAVELRPEWYRAYTEFSRVELPRRIFWLLLAVAEVDGRIGEQELALVREFILHRFHGPVDADLGDWEARRFPPGDIHALATSLRRSLTPSERETVFYWCCQVAFADRRFRSDEHRALQHVARGLGIGSHHARVIFHHAKARFVGHTVGGGEQQSGTWTSRPREQTARDRSLETLGLEPGATPQEIRKRHRELVKRYHPDAHSHLGPVAADEAAVRFREIQAAYETLTRTSRII